MANDILVKLKKVYNFPISEVLDNIDDKSILMIYESLLFIYDQSLSFLHSQKLTERKKITLIYRVLCNLDLGYLMSDAKDIMDLSKFSKILPRLINIVEKKHGKNLHSRIRIMHNKMKSNCKETVQKKYIKVLNKKYENIIPSGKTLMRTPLKPNNSKENFHADHSSYNIEENEIILSAKKNRRTFCLNPAQSTLYSLYGQKLFDIIEQSKTSENIPFYSNKNLESKNFIISEKENQICNNFNIQLKNDNLNEGSDYGSNNKNETSIQESQVKKLSATNSMNKKMPKEKVKKFKKKIKCSKNINTDWIILNCNQQNNKMNLSTRSKKCNYSDLNSDFKLVKSENIKINNNYLLNTDLINNFDQMKNFQSENADTLEVRKDDSIKSEPCINQEVEHLHSAKSNKILLEKPRKVKNFIQSFQDDWDTNSNNILKSMIEHPEMESIPFVKLKENQTKHKRQKISSKKTLMLNSNSKSSFSESQFLINSIPKVAIINDCHNSTENKLSMIECISVNGSQNKIRDEKLKNSVSSKVYHKKSQLLTNYLDTSLNTDHERLQKKNSGHKNIDLSNILYQLDNLCKDDLTLSSDTTNLSESVSCPVNKNSNEIVVQKNFNECIFPNGKQKKCRKNKGVNNNADCIFASISSKNKKNLKKKVHDISYDSSFNYQSSLNSSPHSYSLRPKGKVNYVYE